jgi:hypothetical protein
VVSTEEVSAVAVSMAVGSTGEASAVALSTAAAFVAAVLMGATSAIRGSLTMSSLAASAFRGGGAGAIRTDITVTTITRTITMAMDMDTDGTVTMVAPDTDTDARVTTVAPVPGTVIAAEVTSSVAPMNQVARSIANTNHGVI